MDRKMPPTGGSPAVGEPCSLPAGVRLPFPQLLRPSSAFVPGAQMQAGCLSPPPAQCQGGSRVHTWRAEGQG